MAAETKPNAEERKPHKYEIVDRGEDFKPALKRFTLTIDGKPTMRYSSIPEGMQRIIDRLKKGVFDPLPLTIQKWGQAKEIEELNAKSRAAMEERLAKITDARELKRAREDAAVELFLTSGRLNPDFKPVVDLSRKTEGGPPSKNDVKNGFVKQAAG